MEAEKMCASCRFYEVIVEGDSFGDCHRSPPVLVSFGEGEEDGWVHPTVEAIDWCGEWQEADNEP